jgi:hypothetical protein
VIGLVGDRRDGELSQPLADPAEQVPLRLDDLDAREPAGRVDVAPVRGEHQAIGPDEQRGVRALEAREVAEVYRPGDEEARCAETVQLGSQSLDPIRQARSFR